MMLSEICILEYTEDTIPVLILVLVDDALWVSAVAKRRPADIQS